MRSNVSRLTVFACLAMASLAINSTVAIAVEPVARPNIILIMSDDQGYGDLGCHGNPILKTPHLDQLAAESVRFDDFHVSPTCAPTRASIMTGRHEFNSGVTHTIQERERLSLKPTILPQILKQAGYTTGIFGKWHLGDEDAYQPGLRGFDEVFIHGGGGIGQSYPGSCGDAPRNSYFDSVIRHNGTFVKTTGYCTTVFFEQARTWIKSQSEQQPFFCYITPNTPHAPLDCPAEDYRPYLGKVPEDVAKFYGMISQMDGEIGQLLKFVEEAGLSKNTIIIFMTDNGSANGAKFFNAGMRAGKGTPYEGGIRVPSFWRWSGHWQPQTRTEFACHYDILPTLIALSGATPNGGVREQIQGRSLVPLLEGLSPAWPDRPFVAHFGRWPKEHDPRQEPALYQYAKCSIRIGNWKLVSNVPKGPAKWELYNLKTDPAESKNIADQHPTEVARLHAAYDQWWASVLPGMENEQIPGPKINPFHLAYWHQFQGPGPNHAPLPENLLLRAE
ncbi:MAG: arylsulfatase [Planctomyces sp.]|nr:arylsulfatase [Planctomyces sp.]